MFKNKFIKSNTEQDFYKSVNTYSHEMSEKYDYILHALTSNLEDPTNSNLSTIYTSQINSTNNQFINNINNLRICFNNTAAQLNSSSSSKDSEKTNFKIYFGTKENVINPSSIETETWFFYQEDLVNNIFNTINSSEHKNDATNLNNFFIELNSDIQSKKENILNQSYFPSENISIYIKKIKKLENSLSVIHLVLESNLIQGNSVTELTKLIGHLENAVTTDISKNRNLVLKNLWTSYNILNTSFKDIISNSNSPFKSLYIDLRSILFGK